MVSDGVRMEVCYYLRQGDGGGVGVVQAWGRQKLALGYVEFEKFIRHPLQDVEEVRGSRRLKLKATAAQGAGRRCWLRKHAYSLRLSRKVNFYFSLIFIYNDVKYLHHSKVKSAK